MTLSVPPALHRLMEFQSCVMPPENKMFSITKPSKMHSQPAFFVIISVAVYDAEVTPWKQGSADTENSRCPFECMSLGDPKSIHLT